MKTWVESIKKQGCEYKVVLLDKDNFNRYIDIPKNIKNKLDKGLLSIQNFSDCFLKIIWEIKILFFEYFQVYYFFQFLYKYDDEDKKIIDNLPYNNEHIEDYFYYRNEKFNKNYICDNDVFAKLTYKTDATSALNDPNSLLYHIINEDFE